MRLKDFIEKVLEDAAPGEIEFDLVVAPHEVSDGWHIYVAEYVDAPNASRLKFTLTKDQAK